MLRRAWLGAGPMLLATVAEVVAMDPVQKREDIGSRESLLAMMNCVMASPRAFLMSVPREGTSEWAMIGALENFPRADGDVETPVGTRAIFSLSPETEGAWHEGTYGTIETLPTAQRCEGAASCECDAYATEGLRDGPVPAKNVKTETGGFGEVAPCPWITIAIADTKALSPDEDDRKNSGAGRFSPGVFVATRDRNRAIPS